MQSQQLPMTQKVDITWGEDIKMKKGSFFRDVLEVNDAHIFMSKWLKNDFVIEKFDQQMVSISESVVEMNLDGKNEVALEGIFAFGDDFVILGSNSDKSTKENSIYYKTVSKSNLATQGDWTILASLSFEKKRRDGSFNYTISSDSSKLLLHYDLPILDKDAPAKYGFKVFSLGMKQLWEKEIELGIGEKLFYTQTYRVSNDADVYLIGQEFDKSESRLFAKAAPSDRKYHVLTYSDYGKKFKDYNVTLKDKFITDITISISEKELVCAGFYSEKGTGSIKGTFYLTIDLASQQVNKSTFKEIDEDFITSDWSDRAINKAKKKELKTGKGIEAYDFDLRDFVLKEGGGARLLAEQYYVRVVTTTTTDANGNTRTTTTYHYYYNDVYIVDIAADGNINWLSKIDKYQHSTNDGGYRSSYSLHVKEDKMYLMYNLSAKQYYEKDERAQMSKKDKKAYLTFISEVDSKGNIVDEILINNSQEETYVIPKFCEQISEDKTLIFTGKGKYQKMGIATFK
jgi:hypothetical protein